MADPIGDLVSLLADIEDMPEGLSVLGAPEESITAPALVIRPDPQWMVPDRFCFDMERYNVIAVVSASSPEEGIAMLRSMMLLILSALTSPWDWDQVDGPVVDQSTGVPFLAARLRLKYSNGGPE